MSETAEPPAQASDPGDEPRGSIKNQTLYLGQWEDGLLGAGGLVATISGSVPVANSGALIVAAVSVAVIGKSVPSLILQLQLRPGGPFPNVGRSSSNGLDWTNDGWHPGPDQHGDDWTIYGDMALLYGAAAALIAYFMIPGYSISLYTIFVGAGFSVKAAIDIAEQGGLSRALDSVASLPPKHRAVSSLSRNPRQASASTLGAQTIEDLLLGAFGFSAMILGLAAFPSASLGTALGLAAMGKALPSVVQSATSANQKSGGSAAGSSGQ